MHFESADILDDLLDQLTSSFIDLFGSSGGERKMTFGGQTRKDISCHRLSAVFPTTDALNLRTK